jgi:serine/threonine protein kinase
MYPEMKELPLHYQEGKLVAISAALLQRLPTETEAVITLPEMPDYYLLRGKQKTKDKTSQEWFVLQKNAEILGKGVSGTVWNCHSKIVVDEQDYQISAVHKVAKVVPLEKETEVATEQIKNLKNEAKLLQEYGIQVDANVRDDDRVFLVMDHCGENFKEFLPAFLKNATFEDRCLLAASLVSELLNLKNHDIIHRDLKPDNVCINRIKKPQSIFVDFGLAEKNDTMDDLVCGTPAYMAPELQIKTSWKKKAGYASDIYALTALIAAIFGATNPLQKKLTKINGNSQFHQPFCLDGLFKGFDVSTVEPALLEDIKNILNLMQSPTPSKRPSAEFLVKYFSYILERHVRFTEQQQTLQDFTTFLTQSKLQTLIPAAKHCSSTPSLFFKRASTSNTSALGQLKQQCHTLYQRAAQSTSQKHSTVIHNLMEKQKNNVVVSYQELAAFQDLDQPKKKHNPVTKRFKWVSDSNSATHQHLSKFTKICQYKQ